MRRELVRVLAAATVRPGSSYLTEDGFVLTVNAAGDEELLTQSEWLRRMGFNPETTTCSYLLRETDVQYAVRLATTG